MHNQKAVIPGFGTFMIIQRPAQLNKVTRVLTPPTKVIRFDSNLQTDDGLLAGYIIHKLKQDKNASLEAISLFVKETRDQIHSKGSVLLEGLGTLTRTKSGDLNFIPDDEFQKRVSLFELPKLNIPAAPVEAPPAREVERVRKAPVVMVRKKRRWWIPATILVILAAAVGGVYYTGNLDELFSDVKSALGIEARKESDKLVFGSREEQSGQAIVTDTLTEQISRELDERVDREKALAFDEVTPKPDPSVITKAEPARPSLELTEKTFHIIAGAFQVPNNAERYKASLEKKGLSPVILQKQGDYYMVSLGSYDTHDQALMAMRQMQQTLDKELWVMRR